MSTPPQEPTNPQDPNGQPGASGQPDASSQPAADQPRYGQNPQPGQPQYGQTGPGQNAQPAQPQYGQSGPGQAPDAYAYPGSAGESAAPYAPGAYGSAPQAGPVATPKYVTLAFWLYLASALAFVIGGIMSILGINSAAGKQALAEELERTSTAAQLQGMSVVEAVDLSVGVLTVVFVVALVVIVICYPIWAIFFRKGKGWARIMATIFAAIGIFAGIPLSTIIVGPIAIILGIVAVILLYIGESAAFFRKTPQY